MLSAIIEFINNFGYPVAVSIGALLIVNEQRKDNRNDIKEITGLHRDEMKEITTAINNNTLALTKLGERYND